MKLVNDTKNPKYKTMLFCDLEFGDAFESAHGGVWIKTCILNKIGLNYNAIRLGDGCPGYFPAHDDVFPLNTTLHYKRILEGE